MSFGLVAEMRRRKHLEPRVRARPPPVLSRFRAPWRPLPEAVNEVSTTWPICGNMACYSDVTADVTAQAIDLFIDSSSFLIE